MPLEFRKVRFHSFKSLMEISKIHNIVAINLANGSPQISSVHLNSFFGHIFADDHHADDDDDDDDAMAWHFCNVYISHSLWLRLFPFAPSRTPGTVRDAFGSFVANKRISHIQIFDWAHKFIDPRTRKK